MPMCKKCKEVVGAEEIQDGFCKSCHTPELVAEEKARVKKNKIDRPILITLISFPFIVLGVVFLFLSLFGFVSGGLGRINFSELMIVIGIFMLVVVPCYGLYQMKKWGAYMVILLGVLSLISTIFDANNSYFELIQSGVSSHYAHMLPMIVMFFQLSSIFIVIYYLKKMK